MTNQEKMIELLTGVQSSKRNYYTELRKTVIELQKKNIQLEIINEVMKSFNVDMSIDDMLKSVFEKLKTIFPIERISLSLLDGKNLYLTNVYPNNLYHIPSGTQIPKEKSLYWHVLHSRKAYFYRIGHFSDNWFEEESFVRTGTISVFLFPLIYKGKSTGVLSIGSKELLEENESDQSFFQQLSDQLSVCMENARLYNEVLVSKKNWEETFQAVSDSIFVVSLNGVILQANQAALHHFSNKGEVVGQQIRSLLFSHIEQLYDDMLLLQKATAGELRLDNEICEYYFYPIFDDANKLYASIIYIKDVTAKKQIEAQLIHSGKLAAIGEMAAGVAHELNNPLTAIMGNSQLLMRKDGLSDSSQKLLEDIYECGKRSKNIIRNLLVFSRQEEYLFQSCSINQAIQQVVSLIGNQLQKQAIILETSYDETLPFIEGSSQQIGQIILNLLLNAKDALEDSDKDNKNIILHTSLETVDGSNVIVVSVQDNGTGMEEDVLSEIFHPFYTTKNEMKGTGLGLSVSLGIAEAHGGTIKAESVLGEGSIFRLIVPIQ